MRIVDWGSVTPTVLAQSLPLDQSSPTELADRLERAQLITCARVPNDRRRLSLQATPKGEEVVAEAFGPVFAKLTAIIEATPPGDRATVGEFLAAVEPRSTNSSKHARTPHVDRPPGGSRHRVPVLLTARSEDCMTSVIESFGGRRISEHT